MRLQLLRSYILWRLLRQFYVLLREFTSFRAWQYIALFQIGRFDDLLIFFLVKVLHINLAEDKLI